MGGSKTAIFGLTSLCNGPLAAVEWGTREH